MIPNVFKLVIQRTPDNVWVADVAMSHLKYPEFTETPISSACYESGGSLASFFADLVKIITPESPAHDAQSPTH